MLRKPIRLLLFVLLCGFAPASLNADEPAKAGVKQDSPPKTGKTRDTLLYVRTDPPGATVYLNGKKLGTTNDLFRVDPGEGTILVELEGHQADKRPVIVHANGVTRVELKLLPKAEAAAAKHDPNALSPAAKLPSSAKKVNFSVTSSEFANGDNITIQEVWSERGTLAKGDIVKVKGTYTLRSKPAATFAFYISASSPADAYGPGLERKVQAGTNVPFEMTRRMTCDGSPHIAFYPVHGGSWFGNVYFGVKAKAGAATQTQATPANAKKMKFVIGPRAFRKGDKIEIQEVWSQRGTLAKGDTVKVKGTFTLRSTPTATLAFYVTASSPADAYGPGLERQVKAGAAVPFEMERRITCDGHLHLGLYPAGGGNVLGTIYFGTEAQMKEIADWQESWVNNINQPKSEGKPEE